MTFLKTTVTLLLELDTPGSMGLKTGNQIQNQIFSEKYLLKSIPEIRKYSTISRRGSEKQNL